MKALSRILTAVLATAALATVARADGTLNTPVLPGFGATTQLDCQAVNVGSTAITTVVADLVGTDGHVWATKTCTGLNHDAVCDANETGLNIEARCRVTVTGGDPLNVRATLHVLDTSKTATVGENAAAY